MKKKGIIRISPLRLTAPPPRLLSERQMSELLHRQRVIARKKQIELQKLDNEWPVEPLNLCQYMTPGRRMDLLQYLRMLLP